MSTTIKKQPAKIVVILGPTASGKSDVTIKLAKKLALSKIEGFNGAEIISADSRQIYEGMDIGTGKIIRDKNPKSEIRNPKQIQNSKSQKIEAYYSSGIPHYLINIVNPQTEYNVSKFKKDADKIIKDIIKREKLPIICGGTGFWIKSIVDNVVFPKVGPDWKLRKKLSKKSIPELIQELKKLDARRVKEIDKNNKVRLIRAIEICKSLGKVPKISDQQAMNSDQYEFLQIGINISKEKLHERIKTRLDKRFKQGMVKEVKDLHVKDKVSWKKLEDFGLEYRWIAKYLQGKIKLPEMRAELYQDIKKYAKRQITWFHKDPKLSRQGGSCGANKRIKWMKNYREIEKEVKKFLH